MKAILACDLNWGIGKDNTLPWPKNKADLQWFKTMTSGKTVIMGRATWESDMTTPLPNRRNIVITSTPIDGVECMTLDEFKKSYMYFHSDTFIIGGATFVNSCFDIIDEVWISRMYGSYECDAKIRIETFAGKFELLGMNNINGLSIERWVNHSKPFKRKLNEAILRIITTCNGSWK